MTIQVGGSVAGRRGVAMSTLGAGGRSLRAPAMPSMTGRPWTGSNTPGCLTDRRPVAGRRPRVATVGRGRTSARTGRGQRRIRADPEDVRDAVAVGADGAADQRMAGRCCPPGHLVSPTCHRRRASRHHQRRRAAALSWPRKRPSRRRPCRRTGCSPRCRPRSGPCRRTSCYCLTRSPGHARRSCRRPRPPGHCRYGRPRWPRSP